MVPGQWLGPWVLCHALQAAVAEFEQQQQQQRRRRRKGQQQEEEKQQRPQPQQQQRDPPLWRPLHVHVVCSPGGGAPSLDPAPLRRLLDGDSGSSDSSGAAGGEATAAAAASSSGRDSGGGGGGLDSSGAAVGGSSAAVDGSPHGAPAAATAAPPQPTRPAPALLLLVPLTLGVGRVDASYQKQLAAALALRQSVGIVGGRPGASLFFVGAQEGPGAVVFLDPHDAREVRLLRPALPQPP